MILSSETTTQDAQQMLEFYKQNFAVVELVSCTECGGMLAFECSGGDGMGLPANELGKYIIPIGNNLLSHRVRLDEAPTGERMVGYQCGALVDNPAYPTAMAKHQEDLDAYTKDYAKLKAAAKKKGENDTVFQPPIPPKVPQQIECGNDTRIADVERGYVPVGQMQVALSPFEKHQIRQRIVADKKHKPDFRKLGNTKHFESFQVERL